MGVRPYKRQRCRHWYDPRAALNATGLAQPRPMPRLGSIGTIPLAHPSNRSNRLNQADLQGRHGSSLLEVRISTRAKPADHCHNGVRMEGVWM